MPRAEITWRRQLGLAALSAAASSYAALPSVAGAAIAWIAIVPLLLALETATVRRACVLGGVFGLINALALASALLPIPGVRAPHVLVPSLLLAVYPACWAVAVTLLRRSAENPLSQDGCMLAAWVVLDHVRATAPVIAFPLGSLAQTQVDNLPLLQAAAVLGEGGVTALVMLGNLLVWRALRAEPARWLALRAVPLIASLAFGSWMLVSSVGPPWAPRISLAALHTNYPSFGNAHVPEGEQDRLSLRALGPLASSGARAVFTPETTFINLAAKPRLMQALQSMADRHEVSLFVGVAQAAKFENAAAQTLDRRVRAGVWIFRPHVAEPERYDKFLRVPFREYLPLAGTVAWPAWLVGTPADLIEGPGPRVYTIRTRDAHVAVGAMVCWEGLFSSHARQLARDGAQALFQVSNEGWFAGTSVGARHNAAVRLRAVETGRWIVLASNAGPSEIITANGRVLVRSDDDQGDHWVSANVEPRGDLTIYTRVGDAFVHLCALALACAVVFRHRATSRSRLVGC